MSKQRVINTKFWDDSYILTLDPVEKLLFLYFLTNPLTNICGAYEISLKRIAFDTGIEQDTVLKIFERFGFANKIIYKDGWIVIKNFIKNQSSNPKVDKGIIREIQELPEWVKQELGIAYDSLSKPIPLNLTKLNLTKLNLRENKKFPLETEEAQKQTLDWLIARGVSENLAKQELLKFIAYWTESSTTGFERWQKEKFFEINRRLATWFSRVKQFNKPSQTNAIRI